MSDNDVDIFADMEADLVRRAVKRYQKGDMSGAADLLGQILDINPEQPDALHYMGVIAFQCGQAESALDFIERSLMKRPDHAETLANAATICMETGDKEKAAQLYEKALHHEGENPAFLVNLGSLKKSIGALDEAEALYRKALNLAPDYAEGYGNLANLLRETGAKDEALITIEKAIAQMPNNPNFHNTHGALLKDMGRITDAEGAYRKALALNEKAPSYWNNLANVLGEKGAFDEALNAYQQAVTLQPDYAQAHSNLLCCLQYRPGVTADYLKEQHQKWHQMHALKYKTFWKPFMPTMRALPRMGFVSADFGRHPIGFFLAKILEGLKAEGVETFLYSDRPAAAEDEMTAKLKEQATSYQTVAGIEDSALAEKIRGDQIDILFDLAGHTGRNRLITFAMRPAPVQATWMGYVGTTGMKAMDLLIADRFHVPAEEDLQYVERVVRMPDGYVCYAAPDYAPEVKELPSLKNGYITFGSFNNPAKINGEVVALWAQILKAVENSRLNLSFTGFDDEGISGNILTAFEKAGIASDRLHLQGRLPHDALLEAYNGIDIALDPFPYTGGLTTCEALYMGVPVITMTGQTFAGRHATSHISNVGLAELVATSPEAYIEKAVSLAADLERLSGLRAGLRERVKTSPLSDGRRFAQHLLQALKATDEGEAESRFKDLPISSALKVMLER